MSPTQKHTAPLLVVAALIQQKDRILLTQRPEHKPHGGYWEFPGGKLEANEAPAEALERELAEELGLKIRVDRIAETLYHRYDWGPVLILVYHCTIISGRPRNLEVAAHEWIAASELARYQILPADQPLIDKLRSATP